MRIATGILIVLFLVGAVLLVINHNRDPLDTSYELIAFALGAAGMILSVVAQLDSVQQERINKKMLTEISDLSKAVDAEGKVDRSMNRKLDEILDDRNQKKPKQVKG